MKIGCENIKNKQEKKAMKEGFTYIKMAEKGQKLKEECEDR